MFYFDLTHLDEQQRMILAPAVETVLRSGMFEREIKHQFESLSNQDLDDDKLAAAIKEYRGKMQLLTQLQDSLESFIKQNKE